VTTREEILTAALRLPEDDRLAIAGELLATVSDDLTADWDDEEFLAELERRVADLESAVPADKLWDHSAK